MACIKTAIAASILPNLSLWGPTGADRRPAGLARVAGQSGQSLCTAKPRRLGELSSVNQRYRRN